ncbi:MAG: GTP-binding protein [Alphaproteobacteria bacterium]|jgi:G3E family GTPase|nr:GTP-binding protein [Alphaproteobacteria bacterium]
MSRILVTIITGFLGSGKTTLLNRILDDPQMSDAAVIVNEFGEIGLDYDLVERSDEAIVQLANGCLCCTVKSDLIDTFRDLHLLRRSGTVPKFDRVIIETTGIADPVPVMQIILTNPLVSEIYALDGIVTTVDAVNGATSLDRFAESVKQVAVADRIILTKGDLVRAPEGVAPIMARLRQINPAAEIIDKARTRIAPAELFQSGAIDPETKQLNLQRWLKTEEYDDAAEGILTVPRPAAPNEAERASIRQVYAGVQHSPQADAAPSTDHHHDPLITSFCFVRDEPIPLDTLRLFFEAICREAGPDLLRVKGVVNVAERPAHPALIQGAQMIFQSLEFLEAWPSDDRRTRIIFITRNLDKAYIDDAFALIERLAQRTAALSGAVSAPVSPEFRT